MKCSNCGCELVRGGEFCPDCGTKQTDNTPLHTGNNLAARQTNRRTEEIESWTTQLPQQSTPQSTPQTRPNYAPPPQIRAQQTGIPQTSTPVQKPPPASPNGYSRPVEMTHQEHNASRKGTSLPIILILAALLVIAAAGVFLLLSRNNAQSTVASHASGAPNVSASAAPAAQVTNASSPSAGVVAGKANAQPNPSATPSPKASDSSLNAVLNTYILPDSATRNLTASDIAGLDNEHTTLALYEIFARHNCRLPDSWIQEYFSKYSWYNGTVDPDSFGGSVLNQFEMNNLKLLHARVTEQTGYILPSSDSRLITVVDLLGLDLTTVKLARNEVYARHGRLFSVDWVRSYFESCSWYHGTIDPDYFDKYKTGDFNDFELQNINMIKAFESTIS